MDRTLLILASVLHAALMAPLQNCPMSTIRAVIEKATDSTRDPATQMQIIRRVLEDVHGGSWGVLIIKNPYLVSQDVHWTIPDHTNDDGSPAFCLAVVRNWQYNVFKTGLIDRADRVTVEDVVNKIRQQDVKKRPKTLSVIEFDQKLAQVLQFEKTPRKQRDSETKNRNDARISQLSIHGQ